MEPDKYTEAANVASDYINAYFTQLSRPSTRSNLAALYRPHSTTLWNEMYETGVEQIMNFYHSLDYQRMDFTMRDCKVCPAGSREKGVMVLVTGDMDLDGVVRERVYEVFYLERDGEGWFIGSQILGFLDVESGGGGGLTPS
ncbi:hypothetical protein M409DRAFT_25046 [Zasmidium cellare ATCC 36951]|uniref:NTF2-related export protein n=1 Tax=Zasmidium cellare ATCC 36951 TaxID=1080233 RepID=A0A6A6CFF5_ZASCE|nr:uncharacterized protein M409DRAFT_25046 [Zasmidium cellare ATCC 36951]KAF2164652.1 hypothetical protein M409DRAFT_25046 [Zasmidium cellare ATCC 36951]